MHDQAGNEQSLPNDEVSSLSSWCSVVEKNLGPLSKWISSLVEVRSLVEATCPLDQLLVLGTVSRLILVRTKISIIELLFPRLHVLRRCRVEEAAIGCLELTLANEGSIFTLHAGGQFPGLLGTETERIYSVGAREEGGVAWVGLHILPTGV